MNRPADALYHPHRLGRRLTGPVFAVACFLATLTGIVVLAVLLGSVVYATLRPIGSEPGAVAKVGADAHGGGAVGLAKFLASLAEKGFNINRPARAGYKVGIASSLWLLGLVAFFAVPVGVGAGVFLEEYAPPGRLKGVIQTNIANLAGVPSIVYGLLGLALFVDGLGVRALSLGYSIWAGALTLSLLVLPVIVITTQEALRAVPSSLRHGALALGASKWQVIRDHVLPSALPGILTGVILSVSRAIGETAPVLMVIAATSMLRVPTGPNDKYVPLPVEIYQYAKQSVGTGAEVVAAGGILILLALLLSMNSVAIFLRNRAARRLRA